MSRQAPVVSLLIVAYNSLDFIEACLSSLPLASADHAYEVLLIDNGDGRTAAFVSENFPDVRIIPSVGNVGFGQGNNILAKRVDPASNHFVLINPDTRLDAGAISALVNAAEAHPEYAALGGQIRTPDGSPSAASVIALPSVSRMALGAIGLANWAASRRASTSITKEVSIVEAVSGGFMLVRRDVWLELGGFDETFFLYGEDVDLCRRIALSGGKIGLVPGATVHHDVGSGDFYSPIRTRYKVLANAHFANRHFSPLRRWVFKTALWLRCAIRFGLGSLFGPIRGARSTKLGALGRAFREPALNPLGWMDGYDGKGTDPRRRD